MVSELFLNYIFRFVKRHDLSYDERKREWTFMRERADTDNWPKPGQEIWRCLWVGRYRVDRVHSKNGMLYASRLSCRLI